MATETVSHAGSVFLPRADATRTDLYDELSSKTDHLAAMLDAIYGSGFESFSELSDQVQQSYLWACADLAHDCKSLIEALGPAVYGNRTGHLE